MSRMSEWETMRPPTALKVAMLPLSMINNTIFLTKDDRDDDGNRNDNVYTNTR
jgi:hypothetical protein